MKLATLFAGIAPFIAMSFLLGGIDFVTILVSLLVLFMWSLWACAACLFLSSLLKSRAMSGLVFGGIGIVLLLFLVVFGMPRVVYSPAAAAGRSPADGFRRSALGGRGSWWALADRDDGLRW